MVKSNVLTLYVQGERGNNPENTTRFSSILLDGAVGLLKLKGVPSSEKESKNKPIRKVFILPRTKRRTIDNLHNRNRFFGLDAC